MFEVIKPTTLRQLQLLFRNLVRTVNSWRPPRARVQSTTAFTVSAMNTALNKSMANLAELLVCDLELHVALRLQRKLLLVHSVHRGCFPVQRAISRKALSFT